MADGSLTFGIVVVVAAIVQGSWSAAIATAAAGAGLTVSTNHPESVTTTLGDELLLHCTIETPNANIRVCVFTKGDDVFGLFPGANFEEGRLVQDGEEGKVCGIKITNVEDKDNGAWTCAITGSTGTGSGSFVTAKGRIAVTVAVPPTKLDLRVDGASVAHGELQVHMDTAATKNVQCVAESTRPAPTFKWLIGPEEISADAPVTALDIADGKKTYTSSLAYHGINSHNGKVLTCAVMHPGWTEIQKNDKDDQVSLKLNVLYKPKPLDKAEEFYDLQPDGQNNKIKMKFEANPAPTEVKWLLQAASTGEDGAKSFAPVELIAGQANDIAKSANWQDGDLSGEYVIELTILDFDALVGSGKEHSLIVVNAEGSTPYAFKLQLGTKPQPAGELGSGVIAVVILIVLVAIAVAAAVVARAKGALCFAGHSSGGGEPLTEEKDAKDFDGAEKGGEEPLNPQRGNDDDDDIKDVKAAATDVKAVDSAGDNAAAAPAAAAAADAEEKKSNGKPATPV